MAKVPSITDIRKKIKVNDYTFSKDGLWINYSLDGKEHDLIANPEQTCEILKKQSFINDYSGAGNEITVEYETELNESDLSGNHRQVSSTVQQYWPEFAFHFDLSQAGAISIVTSIEQDKVINGVMSGFASVPDMIRSMTA
jgi:hypothetical protein